MKKILISVLTGVFTFLIITFIAFEYWPFSYQQDSTMVLLGIASIVMAVVPHMKKKIGIPIACFIVIALATSCYCFSGQRAQEEAERHQEFLANLAKVYQEDYETGLAILSKQYVSEDDYKQAAEHLLAFQSGPLHDDEKEIFEKYPYGKALSIYAEAMKIYEGHDQKYAITQYEMALKAFEKFPADYDGPLADRIAKDHLRVQKDYQQAKGFVEGAAREAAAEKAANIAIGESEGKITKVLGQPQTVNTTTTANGTRKQYVYGNGRYVYTLNGIITGMQNIEHQY